MTRAAHSGSTPITVRVRRRWRSFTWLRLLVAVPVVFSLTLGVAWAYWSASSVTGGNGASAATSVNTGATPTATVAGRAVTVTWAATTMTSGQAVTGYLVKRYSGSTAQTLLSACTGTISATTCTENNVPVGTFSYTVTPVVATNWQGG